MDNWLRMEKCESCDDDDNNNNNNKANGQRQSDAMGGRGRKVSSILPDCNFVFARNCLLNFFSPLWAWRELHSSFAPPKPFDFFALCEYLFCCLWKGKTPSSLWDSWIFFLSGFFPMSERRRKRLWGGFLRRQQLCLIRYAARWALGMRWRIFEPRGTTWEETIRQICHEF